MICQFFNDNFYWLIIMKTIQVFGWYVMYISVRVNVISLSTCLIWVGFKFQIRISWWYVIVIQPKLTSSLNNLGIYRIKHLDLYYYIFRTNHKWINDDTIVFFLFWDKGIPEARLQEHRDDEVVSDRISLQINIWIMKTVDKHQFHQNLKCEKILIF